MFQQKYFAMEIQQEIKQTLRQFDRFFLVACNYQKILMLIAHYTGNILYNGIIRISGKII